ncbi:Anoctamin/TMEM 16 [Macrophomina phaseolina MS6]|uniref:Anoctamin/TMEM 16 n=1 Tax=Macrophomina phaseolina (strain MS6) TaxID=1126212 RepID=K2SAS2_MACPH|nr:Anoctamin/TMEM 16 [Macrophomina phaseolina MS6]
MVPVLSLKPPQNPLPRGITYHNVYVVHYNFADTDFNTAVEEFCTLLSDLESVGLHTEVRAGYDRSLLIFVKAPRELLGREVYKSRVKDWLYGITREHPGGGKDTIMDGEFEAEDILSMFHLVTWKKELGGAGITPQSGKWQNVESVFPLHNERANQTLLLHLSKKLFLSVEDLDQIRNLLGSKVAFYFAFLQTYLAFLFFPAITGFIAWMFLPQYSLVYALTTSLWCTVFLEYWKLQQVDLSLRWNVRGVGTLKVNRPTFQPEKTIVDPVSGEIKHYFPKWKQIARQTLQIPFIVISFVTLGALIVMVFAVEVLISEVYEGPFKSLLEYLPTVLLAAFLPFINTFLEGIATTITEYENHRTQDRHEMSLTQKIFVLNFITEYLPIFLTAFVYVPFGDVVIPKLETLLRHFLGDAAPFSLGSNFHSDPNRLRNEVIALSITGQISNMAEELVFPYIKHKASRWWRDYRAEHSNVATINSVVQDEPDEVEFLKRARNEAQLEPYNVQDDLTEMVIQFGYLALFSPVWPLVSVGFLVNNWFELRSDFLKICIDHQRPAPVRTDGIGPWIDSLGFLTWLGSISTAAVVHLFGNNMLGGLPGRGTWYALPITIFISEHIYLMLRYVVAYALQRFGSDQIRKERAERYARRKKYLAELESQTQESLAVEEKERRKSVLLMGHDRFWTRQIEDGASTDVGVGLIKALRKTEEAEATKED